MAKEQLSRWPATPTSWRINREVHVSGIVDQRPPSHKKASRCGAPQASYDRRRHRNIFHFQTRPAQAFPPQTRPCTNWSGRCMYGFGKIEPKLLVPSFKNGAIVGSLGDTGTKMAPSFCWDSKLSNDGSIVEIGQEMTKLDWKVWKKSLQSLRAELQSLRAESIAVCMQRWSFRRRSLSWETSFDWSEMKVRALPGVSPHPAVRTWPGFRIKWTQPDFSWFFLRTIPAAENRSVPKKVIISWGQRSVDPIKPV